MARAAPSPSRQGRSCDTRPRLRRSPRARRGSGAAPPGVLLGLEDQHGGAFAHDEAVPFRVERPAGPLWVRRSVWTCAFIVLKPAIAIGVIVASVPPVDDDVRVAVLQQAQRLADRVCAARRRRRRCVKFGPLAPNWIETWPEAMLLIIIGMKNGLTRPGPFSTRFACCSSKVSMPPMPEPMITPTRSRSIASHVEAARARPPRAAATTANWTKRSFRFASLRSMHALGIEVLHLAREARRVAGRIEARDRSGAALAGDQA